MVAAATVVALTGAAETVEALTAAAALISNWQWLSVKKPLSLQWRCLYFLTSYQSSKKR